MKVFIVDNVKYSGCLSQNYYKQFLIVDNIAPSFTSTETTYTKASDESRGIQFTATDPENKNIDFSLRNNVIQGVTISPAGKLQWSSTATQSGTVDVVVTDVCGTEAVLTVALNLKGS